jgi:hypothetical protein
MPFSVHVEPDSGLAIGTCTGVLRLDDAKAGATSLWSNPSWKGLAVVWDFRHAHLDTSSPEIFLLAQFIHDHQPSPGPARVAMVTGREVDYGQARIFEAFRARPPTEVRVFREFEEAVGWARGAGGG